MAMERNAEWPEFAGEGRAWGAACAEREPIAAHGKTGFRDAAGGVQAHGRHGPLSITLERAQPAVDAAHQVPSPMSRVARSTSPNRSPTPGLVAMADYLSIRPAVPAEPVA